mmetsp:Transcript_11301/g.27066  ORF Transcript_11301/g.27066 Transcript_11301/m.27066 type:complete len:286 (+) Transcript_11301:983-1840(+)
MPLRQHARDLKARSLHDALQRRMSTGVGSRSCDQLQGQSRTVGQDRSQHPEVSLVRSVVQKCISLAIHMVEHMLRCLQEDVAEQLGSWSVEFLSGASAQQVQERIVCPLVCLGEVPAALLPGGQRGKQIRCDGVLLESNSVPQRGMLRRISELSCTKSTFHRLLHNLNIAVANATPKFLYGESQLLRCFRRWLPLVDLLQSWFVRAVFLGRRLGPRCVKIIQTNAAPDHLLRFVHCACIHRNGIHRTCPPRDILRRQDRSSGSLQGIWIRGFELHASQSLLDPVL